MRTVVAILLALALARPAAAESDALAEFFVGERDIGALVVCTGATTAALGAALLVQNDRLSQGASYAILSVSLLELVGGAMLTASHGRQRKLEAARARDPVAFQASERVRMRRIDFQYRLMQALEGVVMASGVALGIAGAVTHDRRLGGAGIGLALQGGFMLSIDLTAHHRAKKYEATLTAK